MSKRDNTSAVVDWILNFIVTGGSIAAGITLPGLLIGLEKPLNAFWNHMDKRERERELRRVVSYMKSNDFLQGDYKHGLQITVKGRERFDKSKFTKLRVNSPSEWDRQWRLIIYDIPEEQKAGRKALTAKLTELGFYQLQRSAWLHPFPCRETIEIVTGHYDVSQFISYIETHHIDNQQVLVDKFKKKYPKTSFSNS